MLAWNLFIKTSSFIQRSTPTTMRDLCFKFFSPKRSRTNEEANRFTSPDVQTGGGTTVHNLVSRDRKDRFCQLLIMKESWVLTARVERTTCRQHLLLAPGHLGVVGTCSDVITRKSKLTLCSILMLLPILLFYIVQDDMSIWQPRIGGLQYLGGVDADAPVIENKNHFIYLIFE